jgi:hypothetical protein
VFRFRQSAIHGCRALQKGPTYKVEDFWACGSVGVAELAFLRAFLGAPATGGGDVDPDSRKIDLLIRGQHPQIQVTVAAAVRDKHDLQCFATPSCRMLFRHCADLDASRAA